MQQKHGKHSIHSREKVSDTFMAFLKAAKRVSCIRRLMKSSEVEEGWEIFLRFMIGIPVGFLGDLERDIDLLGLDDDGVARFDGMK